MKELFDTIVKWLSFNGRINRTDLLLLHILPAFLLIGGTSFVFFEGDNDNFLENVVILLFYWIVATGIIKRFKDIKIKNLFLTGISGLVLGAIISVIVVAVGFVYFLQGISGLGNTGLVEKGMSFIIIPFLLVAIVTLILLMLPGSPHENKFGPVPATRSSMKGALKVITKIVLPLVIFFIGYLLLKTL